MYYLDSFQPHTISQIMERHIRNRCNACANNHNNLSGSLDYCTTYKAYEDELNRTRVVDHKFHKKWILKYREISDTDSIGNIFCKNFSISRFHYFCTDCAEVYDYREDIRFYIENGTRYCLYCQTEIPRRFLVNYDGIRSV